MLSDWRYSRARKCLLFLGLCPKRPIYPEFGTSRMGSSNLPYIGVLKERIYNPLPAL